MFFSLESLCICTYICIVLCFKKSESTRTADLVRLYQANKKAVEMGASVASGGRSVVKNELLPDLVNVRFLQHVFI
jgi:hypothetical protein